MNSKSSDEIAGKFMLPSASAGCLVGSLLVALLVPCWLPCWFPAGCLAGSLLVAFEKKTVLLSLTVLFILPTLYFVGHHFGQDARKPVFGGLRTARAQTSLRIRAV